MIFIGQNPKRSNTGFKSFPIKCRRGCAFSRAEDMYRMSLLKGISSSVRVQGFYGGLVTWAHSGTWPFMATETQDPNKPVHSSNPDACAKQFWPSGEAWPIAPGVYNKIIKINIKTPPEGPHTQGFQASLEICKKSATGTTVLTPHTIPFLMLFLSFELPFPEA